MQNIVIGYQNSQSLANNPRDDKTLYAYQNYIPAETTDGMINRSTYVAKPSTTAYQDNYSQYTRNDYETQNSNNVYRQNSQPRVQTTFVQPSSAYVQNANQQQQQSYISNYLSDIVPSNDTLNNMNGFNDPESEAHQSMLQPSPLDVRKTTTTQIVSQSQKWTVPPINDNISRNQPAYLYPDQTQSMVYSMDTIPPLSEPLKVKSSKTIDPYVASEPIAGYYQPTPSKRNQYVDQLQQPSQQSYFPQPKVKSKEVYTDNLVPQQQNYHMQSSGIISKNDTEMKSASTYRGYTLPGVVAPQSVYPSAVQYDNNQNQFKVPSVVHPTNVPSHTIQTFSVPQLTKRSTQVEPAISYQNANNRNSYVYPATTQNYTVEVQNVVNQGGAVTGAHFHPPSPVRNTYQNPINNQPVHQTYQTISPNRHVNQVQVQPPSPGRYAQSNIYHQKSTPPNRRPSTNNVYQPAQTGHITQNITQNYQNQAGQLVQYAPQTNYPANFQQNQNYQQPTYVAPVTYQANTQYANTQAYGNLLGQSGRYSNSQPAASPAFKGGQSISRLWQIDSSELDFGTTPVVLGSGTFGVVHLAKYRGDLVAVKIPKIGLEDFQKEKDILLSLRHRNIVLCQGEVHLPSGQQGIVLEYMEKGTLKDYIERNHPLPPDQKINLSLGIAKGLAFLHGEAIFHRDLSHNNVLIDDMGTAKITDFGKAKPNSQILGTSGTIGTYLWMPPEAFSGTYCRESDIFSFGILMWEMETGCTNPGPQNQDGQDQVSTVIAWRKNGGIPIIKEDGILAFLIKDCLRYDPNLRPTAVQCVEWLTQLQQQYGTYKI